MLDLGAEQRRFRHDHAAGFEALSAEWHNFLASIDGGRTPPGNDPLARLPETPRVDARAIDAYLRGVPDPRRRQVAADARMREAGFALQQWRTPLASNRVPTDWELWSQGKAIADRYHDAATAGVVDEEGYGEALRFLERHQAPAVARDLLAFRHGIRAWDFAQAAAAADRLMPVVIEQRRWITADELRDGAVMAHLHTGNVAGARAALDALARFSARRPGRSPFGAVGGLRPGRRARQGGDAVAPATVRGPRPVRGGDLRITAPLRWCSCHDQAHRGSPSTVAGATAPTPMKMAQVFVVALWVATALQPVPAEAVNVTVTPDDGV